MENTSGFYQKLQNFAQENKKNLTIGLAVAIVGVGGYIYYQKAVKGPKELAASAEMFKAEYFFGVDSFDLALNGKGDMPGFASIASDYSGTKAGNLANYYAGICQLRLGKFQEAIDYLTEFESNDLIVSALALGAIGDAHRELGNSEEAVSFYEKAAKKSDNSFTAPLFLKKAGMTYEEDLQNDEKALAAYMQIRDNYYNTTEGRDITKFITRIQSKTAQ